MLKFGTRYYMPNIARWTQTDPKAGKPQQPIKMNPYLYTGCNPTNRTDPGGRDWLGYAGAVADNRTLRSV
jgi:RHS repeat-associated protein